MKFTRIYLAGGINGKKDENDFVWGYKADNGAVIRVIYWDNNYHWYSVNGKEFEKLAEAKEYIKNMN